MGAVKNGGAGVTESYTHEMARPYFDRQMISGDRAIFQWTPGKRWPAQECMNPGHPDHGVCPTIHRAAPYYEGVHFASLDAASKFDLESICGGECGDAVCEGQGWTSFDSWEDAESWLRGVSPTVLIEHVATPTQDGRALLTRTGELVR